MLFSQIGQYALRIMTAVVLEPGGEALRATDIAQKTGVPAAYVSKVLRRLTEAGLLQSQKGHHGGFRLQRAPARIRLVDILEAVDSVPESKTCVFGWGACKASEPCPLHPAWSELSSSVASWAKGKTLADVRDEAMLSAKARR